MQDALEPGHLPTNAHPLDMYLQQCDGSGRRLGKARRWSMWRTDSGCLEGGGGGGGGGDRRLG